MSTHIVHADLDGPLSRLTRNASSMSLACPVAQCRSLPISACAIAQSEHTSEPCDQCKRNGIIGDGRYAIERCDPAGLW